MVLFERRQSSGSILRNLQGLDLSSSRDYTLTQGISEPVQVELMVHVVLSFWPVAFPINSANVKLQWAGGGEGPDF